MQPNLKKLFLTPLKALALEHVPKLASLILTKDPSFCEVDREGGLGE